MKTTYINTLDGRTKVDWWEKEDFRGRSTRMYSADSAEDLIRGTNLELVYAVPVPDDLVVCQAGPGRPSSSRLLMKSLAPSLPANTKNVG